LNQNQLHSRRSVLEMFRTSVVWLVAVNMVPLAGVFLLGWEVSAILFLYWAENVVIGLFYLLKMKAARGSIVKSRYTVNNRPAKDTGRTGLMFFFLVHYGMFTLVHGVFVFTLFGIPSGKMGWIGLSLLLLFVSHGVSYFHNFIGREEYLRVSYQDLFIQPYARVVVMHLTIILGGSFVKSMGTPPGALLVMVVLKTGIDIVAHLRERKKHLKKA
jgi:hypothetical protein